MISFPIPSNDDRYYSELTSVGGKNVISIMKQLKPTIKANKTIKLDQRTRCHLDPDLVYEAVEREADWRGCFGQIGAAQSVL